MFVAADVIFFSCALLAVTSEQFFAGATGATGPSGPAGPTGAAAGLHGKRCTLITIMIGRCYFVFVWL